MLYTLRKRDLTLSLSTSSPGDQTMVKSTIPSNSRSIRATSSATQTGSLPASSIKLPVDEWKKLSLTADKCGEVAGLRVESAAGIQRSLLPFPSAPISTSCRFGNLERSNDRTNGSLLATSGGSVSESARTSQSRRRGGLYHDGGRFCTTVSRGTCYKLPQASLSRGESCADNKSLPQ